MNKVATLFFSLVPLYIFGHRCHLGQFVFRWHHRTMVRSPLRHLFGTWLRFSSDFPPQGSPGKCGTGAAVAANPELHREPERPGGLLRTDVRAGLGRAGAPLVGIDSRVTF